MELKIETQTIELAASDTLWGAIYITHNGWFFPEQGWNDLIVAVLATWSKQVERLLTKNVNSETLEVFDGTGRIVIEAEGGTTTAMFYDRGDKLARKDIVEFDLEELAITVQSACNELSVYIRRTHPELHSAPAEGDALLFIERQAAVYQKLLKGHV